MDPSLGSKGVTAAQTPDLPDRDKCTICRSEDLAVDFPCHHALCVICVHDVCSNYDKSDPVCPRCVRPLNKAPPVVKMPPQRKKDGWAQDTGLSPPRPPTLRRGGASAYPHPGMSPIRHKREKTLRVNREEQALAQRFAVRGGSPTRAVVHRKADSSAISPRMVRVPFSGSSNSTPYRVPKPWYEAPSESMVLGDRRLYCDQKVCSKMLAQKDFMRPGW